MERLHVPSGFRVYPWPLYVLERSEARLRVDQRAYQSVVFIGVENERGFTPYGTAVVGAATCVRVHKAGILKIEEPPLDIAIVPISLDPTIYDYFVVKLSWSYFKD